MDESIGANRPFRDIAEGLASRGIAVYRYEKRTKVYPQSLHTLQAPTVQTETINDADPTVALLCQPFRFIRSGFEQFGPHPGDGNLA